MARLNDKSLALLSLFSLGISLVAFSEHGYLLDHTFVGCPYVYKFAYIYSDAHGYWSNCGNNILSLAKYIGIIFLLACVFLEGLIIFRNKELRVLAIRTFLVITPLALVFLGRFLLAPSCIMICGDGFNGALLLVAALYITTSSAIACSVFFPRKLRKISLLFLILIPLAAGQIDQWVSSVQDKQLEQSIQAIESRNPDLCPKMSTRLYVSCVQQVAMAKNDSRECTRITIVADRDFCTQQFIEQAALDGKNKILCDQLGSSQWRENCTERVSDKILNHR